MTGLENTAFTDFSNLVQVALPDLTELRKMEQMERVDWESLVANNQLSPPFGLIGLGASTAQEWGMDNDAYRIPIRFLLVVSLADPSAEADVTAYLRQQMATVRDAIKAYAGTAFQLAGELPTLDTSIDSATNQTLLRLVAGWQSGELTVDVLVGQRPA